jgi:uncharacterized membrane protein YidH (DUF202 family)
MDGLAARARTHILELGGLPGTAKAGIVVIVAGLVTDAFVHTLGVVTAGTLAALVVEQHLAHLVVLVGMVITLAGVVHGGVRGHDRLDRSGRRSSHAVR